MSTVSYPHIEIREDGKPLIVGEGFYFKVRILAEMYLNGMDIAELRVAYSKLSLSQIHIALAYYYDHQEAMDAEIAELNKLSEEFRIQSENSPASQKLRKAMQERQDRQLQQ